MRKNIKHSILSVIIIVIALSLAVMLLTAAKPVEQIKFEPLSVSVDENKETEEDSIKVEKELKYNSKSSMLGMGIFSTDTPSVFEGYVDTLLSKLSSNEVKTQHEGILKAEELFNSIEIQNKKKILVHILGITSLIITIIALSFVSAGFPVITATTIMLVGFAMAICTYLTNKSILQQNGWSFYPSKIIPQCIRKRFNKNVETKARKDTKHLKPE